MGDRVRRLTTARQAGLLLSDEAAILADDAILCQSVVTCISGMHRFNCSRQAPLHANPQPGNVQGKAGAQSKQKSRVSVVWRSHSVLASPAQPPLVPCRHHGMLVATARLGEGLLRLGVVPSYSTPVFRSIVTMYAVSATHSGLTSMGGSLKHDSPERIISRRCIWKNAV